MFVPGALPGETVAVELYQQKKDFARGRVVEVRAAVATTGSTPPCPFVAAGCGGCDWQHVAPGGPAPAQGRGRRRRAAPPGHARRRGRRGPGPARRPATAPRCAAWPPTDASGSGAGTATSVVDVGPCLVAHPLRRRAGRRRPLPRRRGRAPRRRRARASASSSSTSTRRRRRCPTACGSCRPPSCRPARRAWFHEELAGRRWRISARSFFQARPDGAEALVDAVAEAMRRCPARRRAPRRPLRRRRPVRRHARAATAPVTLVEQSASSVADARVNLAGQRRARSCGPTSTTGGRRGPTSSSPTRLAPVSGPAASPRSPPPTPAGWCSSAAIPAPSAATPAARARPATTSSRSQLVDLFPHTSHVEVVSRFDRR